MFLVLSAAFIILGFILSIISARREKKTFEPVKTIKTKPPVTPPKLQKTVPMPTIVEAKPESDAVNHPAHYTDGKIEVIDFIEDKGLNYHRGNAVKYISRAGKKDPAKEIEDLKKARWYIDREIERLQK